MTHISVTKMQFYLGPALSGAPLHFHKSAWNVLIFGQEVVFDSPTPCHLLPTACMGLVERQKPPEEAGMCPAPR